MPNHWKNITAFVTASALTVSAFAIAPAAGPATKPTTKPTAADAQAELERLTGSALNIRAQQTFNKGEYATALPLLKKLLAETEQRGETAKVAAIQERIRVSEKALAAAKVEAE